MKRVVVILLIVCGLAAAQERRKVAVYMAGNEPYELEGIHNILANEIANVISRSEKYSFIDRTEAILEVMAREHSYQRSRAVSNEEIRSLGRQLGVDYVCVGRINVIASAGNYQLDVRLVNVVTGEARIETESGDNFRNVREIRHNARDIAFKLIEYEEAKRLEMRRERVEVRRERVKKTFSYTAVGLDIAGAGLLAYGFYENRNVRRLIRDRKFTEAEQAEIRRNAAYIFGGALLATGITFHILF
ncbi:MAG: penicillin-binding protein activator LpoB [Chitinispirillales bacterium]|jgi:TolB-like protein|nr:penicillin-binding protein activator LpoB [Chitinispirillales bacterium]